MLTWVVLCALCEVNLISHCVRGTHTYIHRVVSLTIQHAASNQASITINKSDDRNNQSVLINKIVILIQNDPFSTEMVPGPKLTSFHMFPPKKWWFFVRKM